MRKFDNRRAVPTAIAHDEVYMTTSQTESER